MMVKNCKSCGKEFKPYRSSNKYCSTVCRRDAHHQKNEEDNKIIMQKILKGVEEYNKKREIEKMLEKHRKLKEFEALCRVNF